MIVRAPRRETTFEPKARRGIAAVELALVLPVLCLICLITIDYSRVMYAMVTVENCARNGALWASSQNSTKFKNTTYTTLSAAALADASNLTASQFTVSSNNLTDAGSVLCVAVTVTYTFTTLCNFPGIPVTTKITRTVTMAMMP